MNVRLLRKIAKVIQEKPAEFNMNNWHCDPETWQVYGKLTQQARACGTTHCIAGWAHLIDGRFPRSYSMDAARKILGVDKETADRLFHAENWPMGFSTNPAGTAKRIEHFIETGGRE